MQKIKKNSVNIILLLAMLVGIGLIAYPTFSDWWNQFHQTRAIASYAETVANMDKETFDRMWAEAEEYNRKLLDNPNRYIMSDEEKAEYSRILDVTGTGIMGYLDIPKIDVTLPIYHGVDEAVLQIAIGHIEGTSFPIGGIGVHSAVSGHRGLPSARLFTDVDKLESGDKFIMQVLDRTITYEVDQIRIVLPEELQDLQIDPEKDYMTLVTCTPYGINSHRLLIRGHRVENELGTINVTADAMQFKPYIVAPLVAAPILLILLIMLLVMTSSRNKRLKKITKEAAHDAVEDIINRNEENDSENEGGDVHG